jgi:MFS superfamily sulfate permease-like transporter
MKNNRESLQTDVALMIAGPAIIAIGFLRLGNNIPYRPDDPRAQPWFDQAILVIAVVTGVFLFAFGAIRLVWGLRDRRG